MFNILGPVDGMRILDLFAGSGLLALEALSRGAEHVTSVERHHRVLIHLRQVREAWQLADRWQVVAGDVHAVIGRMSGAGFDIVLADPPYAHGISQRIPAWLDEFSVGCGKLVIEESARVSPDWPEGWTAAPPRRYGDTCLHFLERGGAI